MTKLHNNGCKFRTNGCSALKSKLKLSYSLSHLSGQKICQSHSSMEWRCSYFYYYITNRSQWCEFEIVIQKLLTFKYCKIRFNAETQVIRGETQSRLNRKEKDISTLHFFEYISLSHQTILFACGQKVFCQLYLI